ncbi:hypothetical protein BDZ45DRAFT_735009 [Acephala macrosclerotiorum]|nr:hypothetical protein BDZ45DRAFT_735009 [Acephala macrosclerotiorum]
MEPPLGVSKTIKHVEVMEDASKLVRDPNPKPFLRTPHSKTSKPTPRKFLAIKTKTKTPDRKQQVLSTRARQVLLLLESIDHSTGISQRFAFLIHRAQALISPRLSLIATILKLNISNMTSYSPFSSSSSTNSQIEDTHDDERNEGDDNEDWRGSECRARFYGTLDVAVHYELQEILRIPAPKGEPVDIAALVNPLSLVNMVGHSPHPFRAQPRTFILSVDAFSTIVRQAKIEGMGAAFVSTDRPVACWNSRPLKFVVGHSVRYHSRKQDGYFTCGHVTGALYILLMINWPSVFGYC